MSTNNIDEYGDLIDQPADVDISQQDVSTINHGTIFPVDCWVLGLRPSSGILKNTEGHNVSETGSVSVLR
jgi:hypothetical protein